MKFNLWFVVLLALMPVLTLFAGLGAVDGFESSAALEVIAALAAASVAAAYLAKRGFARDIKESSNEALPAQAAATPAPGDVSAAPGDVSGAAGYASPPCFLHELDPSYLGYMSQAEILTLLNQLLEAERAGARGVREMRARAASARTSAVLGEIAADEVHFCGMLLGHIARLGGTPSTLTGAFHAKLAALDALDDRLELLNRGQGWVARKLRESIPRLGDDLLRADLKGMLATHQRNIERCTHLGRRNEVRAGA